MKTSVLKNVIFSILALLNWAIAVSVVNAQVNGSVDATFGTNGIANNTTVTGDVNGLVGLGDGKVLGAGGCTTAFGSGVCLYRWTSTGVADTTFGINGVAYVLAHPFAVFPKIVVRPDGRIVVATQCPSVNAICVVQSNANGTAFDPGFAGGSFTTLVAPSGYVNATVSDLALQPDGKLLIGGSCGDALFAASYCVIRLLPSGQIDSTFGTSPHSWSVTAPGADDFFRKLTILPDGRYLASGSCGAGAENNAICVLRYFGNGSLQSSFSVNVPSRFDVVDHVRVVGSFVTISGYSTNQNISFTNKQILAARHEVYAPFGSADSSYGGIYPTAGLVSSAFFDSTFDGEKLSSLIKSDGGIVYVGKCNGNSGVCLARLAPNGNIDTSFGATGRYQHPGYAYPDGSSGAAPTALAESADGKILLGGTCGGARPCVYRFNDVVQSAPKCSLDIDGDGVINATTDGLILLRAMLGFSGTTALANAVAPGAARSTWPQVREYLFDQCRMPVPVQ